MDEVKLIKIVLSRKKRLTINAFSHHAADRPDVNGLVIVIPANKKLGRAVPSCSHIIGHDAVRWNTASKPQVANLDCSLPTHQHILRLDVSVNHINGVHIRNALDEPMCIMPDLSWCERPFLKHFQQIFLHVLANQVDPALLAEGFFKLDDIFVAQRFKDLDFSEDDSFVFFVSIVLLELFDGHQLPRLLVSSLQHHPVLALPDTFQNFVFIHQCNNFKQYPSFHTAFHPQIINYHPNKASLIAVA